MSEESARREAIRYWWHKAGESLASARREFEAGSYGFAVNRLYYASFYAACAALLDRGHSFSKHSGVRGAFHRELVKTGLIPPEWGKYYDQLFEDRQEGDYIVFVTFEREYVELQLGRCSGFLEAVRPVVGSIVVETGD